MISLCRKARGNCADRRFLCFCSMTKTLFAHAMSAAETVRRALGLVPAERVCTFGYGKLPRGNIVGCIGCGIDNQVGFGLVKAEVAFKLSRGLRRIAVIGIGKRKRRLLTGKRKLRFSCFRVNFKLVADFGNNYIISPICLVDVFKLLRMKAGKVLQLKHGVSSLVDIDFFAVDIYHLSTDNLDRFADDADFVFINQNHRITDLYGNFLACGQRDVSTGIETDVHTGVETHHQADAI